MSLRKLEGSEIFCNYGETGSEKLYKSQKAESSGTLSTLKKVAAVAIAVIIGGAAAVLIGHFGFNMPFSCLNNIGVALIGGSIGGICAYAIIKILEYFKKKEESFIDDPDTEPENASEWLEKQNLDNEDYYSQTIYSDNDEDYYSQTSSSSSSSTIYSSSEENTSETE